MRTADLADYAATSLSRLADDLRAAADPGCTSTRAAIEATLAQDRADAVRDLRVLAAASPGKHLPNVCRMQIAHLAAADAGTVQAMADGWTARRNRLDAAA